MLEAPTEAERSKSLPVTAAEALKLWDSNFPVVAVEVGGGYGPSYEQQIHIAIFELIRRILKGGLPESKTWLVGAKITKKLVGYLKEVEEEKRLNLVENQAAYAVHFAYICCQFGYKEMVEAHSRMRRIWVRKWFPKG